MFLLSCKSITLGMCVSLAEKTRIFLDHAKFCAQHSMDMMPCIPIGLHQDGVPFLKEQTIECFTLQLCIHATCRAHIICSH